MKKTIIRVVLAATLAVLALMAQGFVGACVRTGNKQDCQDCCVDTKQDCQKGTLPASACNTFNFQDCINACKPLPHDVPGTEPGTQQQGHQPN